MNKQLQVISNKKITRDMYLIELECDETAKNGQFCMLKVPNSFMTLYRPFSVFDCDGKSLSFLYSPRGEGSRLLTGLKKGDGLEVTGFYGNSWAAYNDRAALVTGGVGLAPLYKLAKETGSDYYVGFQAGVYDEEEKNNIRAMLEGTNYIIVEGGFVTDAVDYKKYDRVYACGPEVMYKTLKNLHDNVYASFERHMACAVGACRSCSVISHLGGVSDTHSVCQDGPIFKLELLGGWE